MIAAFLAAWLYLIAHGTIGTLIQDPADCRTDTECGCSDDCLDAAP